MISAHYTPQVYISLFLTTAGSGGLPFSRHDLGVRDLLFSAIIFGQLISSAGYPLPINTSGMYFLYIRLVLLVAIPGLHLLISCLQPYILLLSTPQVCYLSLFLISSVGRYSLFHRLISCPSAGSLVITKTSRPRFHGFGFGDHGFGVWNPVDIR